MKLIKSTLLALFAIALVGCGGNSIEAESATRAPSGISLTLPTNYHAGETVTGTVTITPAAVGDQTIILSHTPAGSITSIPTTVVIPNGQSSVNFSATMSTTPPNQVSISANADGKVTTRAMWGV